MPPKRASADCANPLYLLWLEELRDAARDKRLRIADVYSKACRSVAACTVKYDRPSQLTQLQGIGPKTVAVLEKKLQQHCEETGTEYPASSPKRPRKAATETGSDEEGDGSPAPPKKKKRVTKPKAYIPALGSGGYGILLGMLHHVTDPHITIQVFVTRGDLVRYAQKYCTSSYDHSERGTWVTAWNSMKTLINKGYMITQGSPRRYSLTEDGYDVAATLRNMHPDFAGHPRLRLLSRGGGSVLPAPQPRLPEKREIIPAPSTSLVTSFCANDAAPLMGMSATSRALSRAPSCSSLGIPRVPARSKFEFWYIDKTGNRVLELSSARVRLCPEEYVTLRRIEFRTSQRSHPFVSQLRLLEETATTNMFAYITEDGAPPKCSGFNTNLDDDDVLPLLVPSSSRARSIEQPINPTASGSRLSPPGFSQPSEASFVTASRSCQPLETPAAIPVRLRLGSPEPTRHRGPRLSSQLPLPGEEREAPDFDPADAIVFPRGTYDIILVLDTREIESRANRDRIADSLIAKGVRVETRALKMGDMCWVARRHDYYGDEEDECVLDYVVERKRLDDLCSSIRDGRYSEQCYRLGRSGISNVFYIVENWQTAARMEANGKQIKTAKSQLQVISGFFLKETKKLSDTIDWLVTMTKVVVSRADDLFVIPSRYLSRTTYQSLQAKLRRQYPRTAFLTTYDSYQALNDKSGARTALEVWGRMLFHIKGMSAERVAAVLDRWGTPRAMFEDMNRRHAEGVRGTGRKAKHPHSFFAEEISGYGRRNIGEALSKAMWRGLWGVDDTEDGTGGTGKCKEKDVTQKDKDEDTDTEKDRDNGKGKEREKVMKDRGKGRPKKVY